MRRVFFFAITQQTLESSWEYRQVKLSGAEIVVQFLKDEGVEYVFGYPGGAVLHIYDALFNQEDVKHILVRHEQGATHSADGYARATGKPGVVLVTSGPGATNAVTGIATAYMDSIPMVIITGQVATQFIGSDAFQEVDAVGITRPCVKHNFLVKRSEDLAETLRKAFHVATTGRPGPVVVDIPKNTTDPNIKIDYEYPGEVQMRSYQPVVKAQPGEISRAIDLILSARRPMIYTGGGVVLSNADAELIEFTRKLGYPITQTLMGLGAYPATDKQHLGMLGMHGTYEANMAMHECDVLIAIGARFDDRVTGDVKQFCPEARIIHIDIDPSSISKNVRVDIPIVGDIRHVLTDMNKAIKTSKKKPDAKILEQWWQQIDTWKEKNCLRYDRNSGVDQAAIRDRKTLRGDRWRGLRDLRRGSAPDVCRAVLSVRQAAALDQFRRAGHHGLRPAGRAGCATGLSGFAGSLCDRRRASIQMCIQELSTALQYMLPVKIVNLNNRYMGMVQSVAGVLLRQPLLPFLSGRVAGLRQADRKLRPRGYAYRAAR